MLNLMSRSRKICLSLALCSLAFGLFPSGSVSAHGDLWKLIHRGFMQDNLTGKNVIIWADDEYYIIPIFRAGIYHQILLRQNPSAAAAAIGDGK